MASPEQRRYASMEDHSSSFGNGAACVMDSTRPIASPGTADSRRERALQYLCRFEYPVELRTLAANVAAALATIPVETVSADERERVAIRLHHVDIPKFVAADIVAYDPESRMVVFTGASEATERYADASDRSRQSDAA